VIVAPVPSEASTRSVAKTMRAFAGSVQMVMVSALAATPEVRAWLQTIGVSRSSE